MAGHSKWKNIRIRKGKQDALRGKLFTKLSREIIMAARTGGADPAGNARLRVAIEKAKENSLPAENIKRALQRGSGEIEGADYDAATYEGYGPGGSALMVDVYTENRNRTVADLRHTFSKYGGNLSENGSVAWQFRQCGQILVPAQGADEESLTLTALDAGADDITNEGEHFVVHTPVEALHKVNDALVAAGFKTHEVALVRIPTNLCEPSEEQMRQLIRLLDALEELDDVQETYVNVEIPEELLAEA